MASTLPPAHEPADEDPPEPRAYASPVCYAHEFEQAVNVPPGIYKAIVEEAQEAIIFTYRDGTIRVWNRGAERLFGHAAADVLGLSLDLIIPERFRRAHWQGFRRAIETGSLHAAQAVMTTRSVHKDGRKLYVELSFGLVRDHAGTAIGAFAIGRDCTARHLAAAGQRASEPPST
jgi:PAS domain S-box-containing protein